MKKIHLEFPLSCKSRNMIWDMVGVPGGMEAWMADEIIVSDDKYTFCWGDERREAQLIAKRIGTYVRFHWLDESPKTFFELRINYSELTGSFTLEVTEQTDDEDVEGLKQLWEGYADTLSRVAGV